MLKTLNLVRNPKRTAERQKEKEWGQTTGNIWAPKYYIFPINDLPHRTPSKKIRKIRKNFQAKAIQGHVPWVNLKKNFQNSFSQYANIVRTPLLRSMYQAQNTDTQPMHSISWGCPKMIRRCDPISLLINTFGIHLEPGCKSHEQIIHYRAVKNVQKQATVLLYF